MPQATGREHASERAFALRARDAIGTVETTGLAKSTPNGSRQAQGPEAYTHVCREYHDLHGRRAQDGVTLLGLREGRDPQVPTWW